MFWASTVIGVARIMLQGGTGAWRTGSEVRGDKVIQKWKPSGVRSAKFACIRKLQRGTCPSAPCLTTLLITVWEGRRFSTATTHQCVGVNLRLMFIYEHLNEWCVSVLSSQVKRCHAEFALSTDERPMRQQYVGDLLVASLCCQVQSRFAQLQNVQHISPHRTKGRVSTTFWVGYGYDDDADDEIAYFTVCWKTRELVLSTAPKTWEHRQRQ